MAKALRAKRKLFFDCASWEGKITVKHAMAFCHQKLRFGGVYDSRNIRILAEADPHLFAYEKGTWLSGKYLG